MAIDVIYSDLCPVCGEDLSSEEIEHKRCAKVKRALCSRDEDPLVEGFYRFFRKCVGEPRAIQKMWAKRILRGESFAATAPTGVGKTSFGVAMSVFLALRGKRCYLLFPTSLLVMQAVELVKEYFEKAGVDDPDVGYYHGRLGKKDKEEFFKNIKDFKILITTTQFLSKHFGDLKGLTFDFIFVDDVDAILKASKNVDRILQLLGFYWDNGWKGKAKGCLMVSTATAKKGKKAELFRTLLNFDIGSSRITVRNIVDVAVNDEERLEYILQRMGSGGIIFARTTEDAEKLHERLRERFRVGIATSGKSKDFERFAEGEIDHLIGTAYYYGTLVRGLDLPERIRFAVFVGCPVFRVKIEDIETLSLPMLRTLAMVYRHVPEVEELLPRINDEKVQEELKEILKRLLGEESGFTRDIVVRRGEVIFPDIRTYIQGSGRTSRLFAGGLTKGASFLLENDVDILKAFIERARYYDIEFTDLESLDFDELIREIDETRSKFKRRGEFDLIKPALFIVESPTKARQISRFFGKPSVKVLDGAVVYEIPMEKFVLMVTASIGHITDLITNRGFHGVIVNGRFIPVYASIKRCRSCGYQFTEKADKCPKCGSEDIDDSKNRVDALRKLAHDAEFVIIGTDPDTEGEKIAWDLKNLLAGCGEIRRAEFHEVTRRAVMEAFNNLRDVEENLVKAQMVRRIEDRWIGFVLSQKLWEVFKNRNLSAGRAQTPVLGWVIERYRESRQKKTIAVLRDLDLTLEYDKAEFDITIRLIEERVEKRTPTPPYTTDSMLRDANQILKFSAKQTMQIAQNLFENGLITYHRTDSTRVSEVGQRIAREYLGEDFVGRDWGEGGAHECIRPTRAVDRDTLQRLVYEGVIMAENLTWQHYALYDLIFRRFMASQCKPYEVRVTKYLIEYDGERIEEERIVSAKGRAFDLYKAVWVRKELPEGRFHVKAELKKVPKTLPLTQSEIVQMMRERGIGRPSTYATIIDKLFLRNYVSEKYGRVLPTKLGMKVYSYLISRYRKFVSEERTRDLESRMDAVERGELDYNLALKELYDEIRKIKIKR